MVKKNQIERTLKMLEERLKYYQGQVSLVQTDIEEWRAEYEKL